MTELERGRRRQGHVVEFDAETGLGVVEADDGERHAFHCIEIADGTRDVQVGAPVDFDLLPKFGRWEAADLRT